MRKIYTGIDIGTYHVKVVIAAPAENPELPMHILGTGTSTSRGMRHGYIIDPKEASKSIREALMRASMSAKVPVKRARIALGGIGLDEMHSSGDVTLTQSGGIVTDRDIERALRESEKRVASKLTNRTIFHAIPLESRVDGTKVFGKPHGLQGTKLSIDTLIVTILSKHHDDLTAAVEDVGIEVEDVMAAPLAASLVTLTKAQKTAGVVLANIGAETLSIIVFDNTIPISLKIFPLGSSNITNSIALTFRIPLTEAESLKRGGVTGSNVSQKKMQSIIASELKEMFTLINAHLKSIGRQRLLPAGIVITGGGSGFGNAQEVARQILKLPASLGQIGYLPRSSSVDASLAVAYGLCKWAYGEDIGAKSYTLFEVLRNAQDSIKNAVRSLLP